MKLKKGEYYIDTDYESHNPLLLRVNTIVTDFYAICTVESASIFGIDQTLTRSLEDEAMIHVKVLNIEGVIILIKA